MPRISAHRRLEQSKIDRYIGLASAQMLLTTSNRLAELRALAAVLAVAAMQSVSAKSWWRRRCEREKHDAMAHSHRIGQELDLICNHNFV
jgi:hypothetical protein